MFGNISALGAAVLEVNSVSLHQPIESVVLSGNTEWVPQDSKAAADLLSGLLGGLSPGQSFLLSIARPPSTSNGPRRS